MSVSTKLSQYIKIDILELEHKIEVYKKYLDQKILEEDDHGIWDSACELNKFRYCLGKLNKILKEAQDESSGEKSSGVCKE